VAFTDLRDFVASLDAHGRLRRIAVPVSRDLEITEIVDRVSKTRGEGNVALLFEHVEGFEAPVLVNAFGSEDRMALALGVARLDELGERIATLLDARMPGTFGERLRKLGTLIDVARAAPRRVTTAPCQEIVETASPSLAGLPILQCWPGDGGRYITLPGVFTRDPVTGARNVGMYRLQVYDDRTLGMHWQTHKGGAEHQRRATDPATPSNRPPTSPTEHAGPAPTNPATTSNRPPTFLTGHAGPVPTNPATPSNRPPTSLTEHAAPAPTIRMPVAIALGGDPAMIYAASAPLPPGIDEVVFAGWLRGAGVEMVRCRTNDLEVPAQAEIVLEGWVDPREQRLEGPFGDHTGYYSLARDYPVFHLTAVTRRARPIYPTTIVGRPPQEDYWLGKATERLFLPIMRLMVPEIVDVNMPAEGVFHNLVIVSIRKRYPGQARKVMQALWGMGLMMLAKTIVVVSEHVNVHDLSEVAWRATSNIDPRRDLVIIEGPMDDLDHAALRHRFGGKLGVDATEKGPLDDVVQAWPDEIRMSEEIRERVTRRWKDYGL
jgi:4-hydroxy-3-polyprenylbenzoate decarboxylase